MNTINKTSQVLTAIIITFITVGLISCDDRTFGNNNINRSNTSPNFAPTYSNNNFEIINDGKRVFTDEQIEKIGQLHNEICMNIIDNLSVNDSTYDVIRNIFKSSYMSPYYRLESIPTGVSFIQYSEAMFAYNIPTEIKTFIDDALYYVINNCENVQDISLYVEGRKDIARGKFKGANLDIVLTGLTVLKYSAKLWLDKSNGGLGYYVKLLNNSDTTSTIYNLSQEQKEKIKDVLRADLEAACIFIAVGIVIAAIEVVTCGAATLAASAIEAIMMKVAGHAAIHSVIEIVDIVNKGLKVPANLSPLAIKMDKSYRYKELLVGNPF